jgi:hypothetical protein
LDAENAGEINHHKHPLIWRDGHLDGPYPWTV